MANSLESFTAEFRKALSLFQRVIITTHMNPDGDGLGSELAVYSLIKKLGKEVLILNSDPVPENYKFLCEYAPYTLCNENEPLLESDIVVILDISTLERLGTMSNLVSSAPSKKICIDHHASNSGFADLNYIDSKASSTGELVYRIAKSMNIEIDKNAALGIYTAILTDTGAFKYSNTTSEVHRITAEMIEIGVSPDFVYSKIYEQKSEERMRLLGEVLTNIQSMCGGRIVWSEVTLEMRKKENVEYEETDGFIDQLGFIGDIEIYLLFLERDDGKIKVSLRSKNDFDVNKFAKKFNGGGHSHAAGILLEGNLEDVKNKILSSLKNDIEISSRK
ncbi:MAG: bifunctional oligoribonuclease/PAP phosphatase NrnA [Candidatus Schekmanbacteria bacterium]|nr:MAG: bifunctional oligoribonuclease/PAP phosphatase NrnA [Candidatus Schekmanbacteria bacterium]